MSDQVNRKSSVESNPLEVLSRSTMMPSGEPDEEAEDVAALDVTHQRSERSTFHFWTPPPLEIDALAFFFNKTVSLSETSEDSASGWLSELRSVHKETKPGSHLDTATVALSWINLGTATQRPEAIQNAREAYGAALSKTREALNNPVHVRTDETLVAVLILGYFEFIMSTYENTAYSDDHGGALPTLLRERGEQQLKERRSRKLFFTVQNQITNICIENSGSANTLLGGLSSVHDEPDNPGARLRNIIKEVNEVQVFIAAIITGGDNDEESRESVDTALDKAVAVDHDLVQWSLTIRDSWKFRTEDGSRFCKHPDQYWKHIHIYSNLWICRVWNQFRTARIKLQDTMLKLVLWARSEHGSDFAGSEQTARDEIQAMADDVCASVPYCLGNQTPLDKEPTANFSTSTGVRSSSSEGNPSSQGHGLGWFLCLVPLRGLSLMSLPGPQIDWINKQLLKVCQIGARSIGSGNPISLMKNALPTFVFAVPMTSPTDSEVQTQVQIIEDGYPSPETQDDEVDSPKNLSNLVDIRSEISDRMSRETPGAQAGLSFFNTTNPDQIKDKTTQKAIRRKVMLNYVQKHKADKPKVTKSSARGNRQSRQKLPKNDKSKG